MLNRPCCARRLDDNLPARQRGAVSNPNGIRHRQQRGCRAAVPTGRRRGGQRRLSQFALRWDVAGLRAEGSDLLSTLAQWRWDDLDFKSWALDWALYEPIELREVGSGDGRRYRLEYRRQTSGRYCVTNRVEIIARSPQVAENDLGFSAMGSVCEDYLDEYDGERQTILDGFRP